MRLLVQQVPFWRHVAARSTQVWTSSGLNINELRRLIEIDPRQTTRELGARLGCVHSTIAYHLHQMGKVLKLGCWIPHELTQDNIDRRIDTCHSLLLRSRRFDWLRDIIPGDEKWVLYVNHTRKRQWVDRDEQPEPEPKADFHLRKVMLSVWWDVQGVVHFELLPVNTTVDATLYCSQLDRFQAALLTKRPGHDKVILQHDNARAHAAKKTPEKLVELGW
jgi:histone-lysine N-methyltransferase SETMAR